jgi:ZIP family zinc transporter
MSTIFAIIILSFLSGITSLIGVWLALRLGKRVNFIVGGLGFSAGIMLLISFFELLPESINATGLWTAIISLTAGILLIFFFGLYNSPHTFSKRKR